MDTVHSHKIWLAETDRGTFVVTSAEGPYFCFECQSEQDAIATATRALEFYFRAETPRPRPSMPTRPRHFVHSSYKQSRTVQIAA